MSGVKKNDFRFNALKVHLTYKGHFEDEEMFSFIEGLGGENKITRYSHVSEVGDVAEDDDADGGTPYDHTHVAVQWKSRMQTTNQRFFDFKGIHPNIQAKKSNAWFKGIIMKYHKGHKTKKDGKKYYIAPVKIDQRFCEDWRFEEEAWERAIAAPTLRDACVELDIVPKSIADVEKLRKQAKKRKATELEEGVDPKRFKQIEWDRTKALVVRGEAGLGKTNWALSQFSTPHLVSDIEDLRNLPDGCDGVVFDEMLFAEEKKKNQVYLLDMKFERTIRMRNVNSQMPRGMQRIFCCNENEIPFNDQHWAIKRRYNFLEWDGISAMYD